jgi:hypothetical protein
MFLLSDHFRSAYFFYTKKQSKVIKFPPKVDIQGWDVADWRELV